MSSPIRKIARPLVSSIYVASGINTLRNSDYQVQVTRDAGLPNPEQLVRVHAAGNVVGGLAFATGRFPRLAALGMAVNLLPTTYVGHPFWNYEGQEKQMQQVHFFKNLSLIGGLLLAVADTGGRESVTHAAGRIAGDASSSAHDKAEKLSRKAGRKSKRADKLAGKARSQADKLSKAAAEHGKAAQKEAAKQAKIARKEGGKRAGQLSAVAGKKAGSLSKQAQKKAGEVQHDLAKRAA